MTLTVEDDADDDGPYPAVRIGAITIPDAWRDQLGPHARLLTDYAGWAAAAFPWCWGAILGYALMEPTWDADQGWLVTVVRDTWDTPGFAAREVARAAPER